MLSHKLLYNAKCLSKIGVQSSLSRKIENRPVPLTSWSWIQITASSTKFTWLAGHRKSMLTDFLLLNHLIILAKQHFYSCCNRDCVSSLNIYLSKVAFTYCIETVIADSNGKRSFLDAKRKK